MVQIKDAFGLQLSPIQAIRKVFKCSVQLIDLATSRRELKHYQFVATNWCGMCPKLSET